jgi:hypothetical protein
MLAELDRQPLSASLELLRDERSPVPVRGLAAWAASDIGWDGRRRPGGDLKAVLRVFSNSGAPEGLLKAAEVVAVKARTPMALMVPLVWAVANAGETTLADCALPQTTVVDEVPMYALDKHTRGGREAIRMFARLNRSVSECLSAYARSRTSDAAYMAAFYTDAMPTARRLHWQGSHELEAFGTEADMLSVGVAKEGVGPLLQVFRENLDHLNELRGEVYRRTATGSPGAQRLDRVGLKESGATFDKLWGNK